jgi:DNA mismatch repair protein MutS
LAGDDVPFLRTVYDGATDRSYGIHVANLVGVPVPVVERLRDVLDRLREETTIEAKGSGSETSPDETVQAVFDLGGGEFREDASSDGGSDPEALDPATGSVLAELADVDVKDTSSVDLLSRVQAWQRRLEE